MVRWAKTLKILFCSFLIHPLLPLPAQADLIVRVDTGGSIEARLGELQYHKEVGTNIVIKGQCDSSCTMYLALPNTCVEKSARFGFHGPQSQYYGVSLTPDQFDYWSDVLSYHYPPKLKLWFDENARDITLDVVKLTGKQVIQLGAKPCSK